MAGGSMAAWRLHLGRCGPGYGTRRPLCRHRPGPLSRRSRRSRPPATVGLGSTSQAGVRPRRPGVPPLPRSDAAPRPHRGPSGRPPHPLAPGPCDPGTSPRTALEPTARAPLRGVAGVPRRRQDRPALPFRVALRASPPPTTPPRWRRGSSAPGAAGCSGPRLHGCSITERRGSSKELRPSRSARLSVELE